MTSEIPTAYDPRTHEISVYQRWRAARAFAGTPDDNPRRFVVMMPLPNVTGALHMGHAMDNVMQDLLVRWHRMRGDNTLWMPGTDHAGIATQAVVEKRLFELEGKSRHDIGRAALVARIWEWKDQYQKRIIRQQEAMGCSCDWERQRFTMDAVCRRAVRHAFFRLFADGLIYRGLRLVNWDCHLQTAVADDEIVHETVRGSFWHLRYPVIDPGPGEPTHVIVATTRPETMLGDTAVAVHPDPADALDRALAKAREKATGGPARERAAAAAEVERLEERRRTHLPTLVTLAGMARAGRGLRHPFFPERPVPLIADGLAQPALGSGCVKITPAHDPNDYEVWRRARPPIACINILNADGTLNEAAGPYQGFDRLAARPRVVADLERLGLLAAVEERDIEIGHSDRSRTPIEPWLSQQWFVRMGDVAGGVTLGRGTPHAFRAAGLAQAAIDAASPEWSSPSGRRVAFHPDAERYAGGYRAWLAEKRDWCISRQLWWGHRIPVWTRTLAAADAAGTPSTPTLLTLGPLLRTLLAEGDAVAWLSGAEGDRRPLTAADLGTGDRSDLLSGAGRDLQICLRDEAADTRHAPRLDGAGFVQDPDVLDTWFSSGLWPHSTLGWPDPASAPLDPGAEPLAVAGRPDALSYYYPGSCLVTGRDILTLWVVRMVILGLYNLGDVPFTDVFLHANILDGKGERMSKSKGNGIDPVDIIERYGADAMRYVLCEMQTGTQDIRLPVQAISPFTGEAVDLATARRGRGLFTYLCPGTGKEFDVLGTMPDVPAARLVSDRFEVGRNFCNKLWNATRFALLNLADESVPAAFRPLPASSLAVEDRWILSRLAGVIDAVDEGLRAYNPAAALGAAREFFWGDLCDWYLEMIKPRLRAPETAPVPRQVLATVLDQVLRLLHPFTPFITEVLWERLHEQAPVRGLSAPLPSAPLLVRAAWPQPELWRPGPPSSRTASRGCRRSSAPCAICGPGPACPRLGA